MAKIKFNFVNVVWGSEFVDFFINYSLPSQLSSGNLGAFFDKDAVYQIFTPKEEAAKIKNSWVYGKLSELVEVDIREIDAGLDLKSSIHEAMSQCHKMAIQDAIANNTYIVFLAPDVIWSDGTFSRLFELAESGKKAVMISSIRCDKQAFIADINGREGFVREKEAIVFKPGMLVRLMLDNLHIISQRLCRNSKIFSQHPSHIYFPVDKEGILARCFHLHPLMFYPDKKSCNFNSTIDADLIGASIPDPEKVYVVTDSNEILGCELSDSNRTLSPIKKNRASIFKIALWAKWAADRHHRYYLKYKIFFNAGAKTDRWAKVEAESDKFVRSINSWLKLGFLFNNKVGRVSITGVKQKILDLVYYSRVNAKRLLKGLGVYEFLKRQKNRVIRLKGSKYVGVDEVAKRLLDKVGCRNGYELEQIKEGANNKVYKVIADNSSFLLKSYFNHEKDLRDRLGTEFAFTSFACKYGVRDIPRHIVFDRGCSAALYEFVKGKKLGGSDICKRYVQQAVDFFCGLNTLRINSDSIELPIASEACFSIKEHLHCVERRLGRFRGVKSLDGIGVGFKNFLYNDLFPAWGEMKEMIRENSSVLGIKYGKVISMNERCISPSDFGFHNAILRENGRLCFIDFEYAGWDDPAKLVCDFFSQPKVPVSREYWPSFEKGLGEIFGDIDTLKKRIDLLFGLYKIKWCCIMLNDFLLVENQRRDFAGCNETRERKQSQLEKAKSYFSEFYNEFKTKGRSYGLC